MIKLKLDESGEVEIARQGFMAIVTLVYDGDRELPVYVQANNLLGMSLEELKALAVEKVNVKRAAEAMEALRVHLRPLAGVDLEEAV